MNPLSRFLDWRRDLLTPEHVEKASRRERWKRQAWLFSSTILAVSLAFAIAVPLGYAVGASKLLTSIAIAVLWFAISPRLFNWGVSAFDLVTPWQFRDAEVEERETA